MSEMDEQDQRIAAILGPDCEDDFDLCLERLYEHLCASLQLPCEVTGIEDFGWEEYYVIGPGDRGEYKKLRKDNPSYRDVFELLSIEKDTHSEWKMFEEDLVARVRRKSDGKEFDLGLAEIKAVSGGSPNHRLLDDYATWLVNSR